MTPELRVLYGAALMLAVVVGVFCLLAALAFGGRSARRTEWLLIGLATVLFFWVAPILMDRLVP